MNRTTKGSDATTNDHQPARSKANVPSFAARVCVAFAIAAASASCGRSAAPSAASPVDAFRNAGAASSDGEQVGRWLVAELIVPGGDAGRAKQARARLDKLSHGGMYASLAIALDDGAHGRLASAEQAYLAAVRAARDSNDAAAPLVSWFATHHWLGMRTDAGPGAAKERTIVADLVAHPGHIGWRARGELVSGLSDMSRAAGERDVIEKTARLFGCATAVRLAGPFGHAAAADRRRAFDAEAPGPWLKSFRPEPGRHVAPHLLTTERHGCQIQSSEATPPGIYYAETFVDLPAARDVVLSVQGAYRILVDDMPVLDRDTRVFGVWTKFGAHLRLEAGRHRIVARIGSPQTFIRLLSPDGSPLDVKTSDDPRPMYGLTRPVVLDDPNVLDRFVAEAAQSRSAAQSPSAAPVSDPIQRFLAASLSHVEGEDDLASVLIEPLVADRTTATALSLAEAATFAESDPIFPESDRLDLVRDLRTKAVKKDAGLYYPRYWLALDEGDKRGLADAVGPLKALATEFGQVPDIGKGLAAVYGKLGWSVEHDRVVLDLVHRFSDDPALLADAIDVLDGLGKSAEADRMVARIKQLDPDSDIDVDRALSRRDYAGAIAALKQLAKRRPDRKDIANRITSVMARAGDAVEPWKALEKALAKKPEDSATRLKLADARFAQGDHQALRRALADAILVGGDTSKLADALELVEGATELEPFRLDGRKIIDAYEKAGVEMEGTAARVLDYSAVWVHPDGSSRMLEHELIRLQSQEAAEKMTEQKVPDGLMLRMRVIKKDGTVLEPEFVSGKPTLTMPHLEVGDYIETESISAEPGDGQFGQRYVGPHWFFREADVAYWRSEFVVIVPADKKLQIETQGDVPPPQIEKQGEVTVYRWRVDKSPAAPEEPGSPPIQEFLPSVRVGWGIALHEQLERLRDVTSDELAPDPRIRRIAEGIVGGASSDEDRARRLYRWVSANVENGREGDGRRVVIGKSGNRTAAFLYLCRTAGVPVELAVARSRLAPKPNGPIAEAESYRDVVVRVGAKNPVFLTVQDKHAPFGYVPADLRGQPAYRLVPGLPLEVIPKAGSLDGVVYDGKGELHDDGSATLEVSEQFLGQAALSLRAGLEQLAEAQVKDAVESRLVGRALPGARLTKLEIENQSDYDRPVVLKMKIEAPSLARRRGGDLILSPPFVIRVSQLATLPRRQTPMLIGEPTFAKIRLSLALPKGARVSTALAPRSVHDADRTVSVQDRQEAGHLLLDRTVDIPAGRVQPSEYADFQGFAQRADEATMRDIVVALP